MLDMRNDVSEMPADFDNEIHKWSLECEYYNSDHEWMADLHLLLIGPIGPGLGSKLSRNNPSVDWAVCSFDLKFGRCSERARYAPRICCTYRFRDFYNDAAAVVGNRRRLQLSAAESRYF